LRKVVNNGCALCADSNLSREATTEEVSEY